MHSLVPRPPPFQFFGLRSVLYTEVEECEKRGRPGLIHHVSNVRWTRGGCENDVGGRGPTAQSSTNPLHVGHNSRDLVRSEGPE